MNRQNDVCAVLKKEKKRQREKEEKKKRKISVRKKTIIKWNHHTLK
tara:strand:- start:338 stop:475 length:138 start_codon:yes stop_codon:yes gene_type:complete